MRLQQGIEDLPGIAVTTINLATAYHRLGDGAAARRLLDAVLDDKTGLFPPATRSEAAFRRAVMGLDAGETTEALANLSLARNLCAQPCRLETGLLNVEGRLALATGDHAQARALATAARDRAEPTERDEQANAIRIIAAADALAGQLDAALAGFQNALARDKELAAGDRIIGDLEAIADILTRLGRYEDAKTYRQRAAAVREARRQSSPE
ncbi:hypothetical protein CCP3SC15_1940005 [Gammaproteobacteria bacterium]